MNKPPANKTIPSFPSVGSDKIVAPFAADIDTTSEGRVRYANFATYYGRELQVVAAFINSQIPNTEYFFGSTMMVAEWESVPRYGYGSVSLYYL